MRLLHAESLELSDFQRSVPPYAILSDIWGRPEDEVTFPDLVDTGRAKMKPGFAKINGCCRKARQDGIEYVWIDSCCIDKSSSAELSEAINIMYKWYRDSRVCYAYLEDVTRDSCFATCGIEGVRSKSIKVFYMRLSLQELMAPVCTLFFNHGWENFAKRASISKALHEITGIPRDVLHGVSSRHHCVAQRMFWITRDEDIAYCLLGLSDISMPLLYGQGSKAFIRL
jgi:hypothetical protein